MCSRRFLSFSPLPLALPLTCSLSPLPPTHLLSLTDDTKGLPLGWVQHGEGSGCDMDHSKRKMVDGKYTETGHRSCDINNERYGTNGTSVGTKAWQGTAGWEGYKYIRYGKPYLDENGKCKGTNGMLCGVMMEQTNDRPVFDNAAELVTLCGRDPPLGFIEKVPELIANGMKVNPQYLRGNGTPGMQGVQRSYSEGCSLTALMECAVYAAGDCDYNHHEHSQAAKLIIAADPTTDHIRMQNVG